VAPARQNSPPVHAVSGAAQAHTDDLNRRVHRYLVSMAIRTACVVLAVVVPSPWRWAFAVGAVLLPYLAVVMANARPGRRRGPGPHQPARAALPAVGEAQTPSTVTIEQQREESSERAKVARRQRNT
jgi:hypothetical protein